MLKNWFTVIALMVLTPFGAVLLYLTISIMSEAENLNNGYEYVNSGRYDSYYIKKNDQVVIESAVIDISQSNSAIVGIRLPRCSNTHEQKIVLSKQIAYFVINTKTETIAHFNSKKHFEKSLDELGILQQTNLDYEGLYRLRKNLYKKYNASSKTQEILKYCNSSKNQNLTH